MTHPAARCAPRLAAAALAAFAALSGCRGQPAEPPPPPAGLVRLLEALPRDATIVAGLDLPALLASRFAAAHGDRLAAHASTALTDAIAEARACDLVARVERAAIALGEDLADTRGIVVALQGGFDAAAVSACVTTRSAGRRDPITIGRAGSLTTYTTERRGRVVHALWTASDTVALAPEALEDPAALADVATAAAAHASPAPAVAELHAALADDLPTATLWAAGLVPDDLQRQLGAVGHVPDGFFVALRLAPAAGPAAAGPDVAARVGLRYGDPAAAAAVADLLDRALAELHAAPPAPLTAATFARLRVERGHHTVAIVGALSLAELVAGHTLLAARWPFLDGPSLP